MPSEPDALRALPKVDALAADARFASFPPSQRTDAARNVIQTARETILRGETPSDLHRGMLEWLSRATIPEFKTVINLSGVILHTGLGRARLTAGMLPRLSDHVDLEFDLDTGQRGDRMKWVRPALEDLTGAEDALVVNNCAAGVWLTLAALGGPVILSRGQMVEIGGSFRMPDVIASSGSQLIEVGCTNKTHRKDYELAMAMSPSNGVLLRCSQSNFRQSGFVAEVSAQEMAELAHAQGWTFVDDMGSGCLLKTEEFGLPHERTLREAIDDGADVVIASGDKLLGGPQAGVILGRRNVIAKIKSHPIARAVRADKWTLATLSQTLRAYQQGNARELPVWESVRRPLSQVKEEAQQLANAFRAGAKVEAGTTQMGGGAMPGVEIATFRARLDADDPSQLAARLRALETPLIGTVEQGQLWLDPRTANPKEISLAVQQLSNL
ncbi:MAG: L-seryl-tRNA(Sec) selenium transferase [Fimbriimonadaceae bacterium]|nr:L-seryl-tRNA(Sec) selenium transferase [Fimbriimonadaceae bacterium]